MNISHDIIKKNGYFELNIEKYESLKHLIEPDKSDLRDLMTQLKYEHEPKVTINLPRFGSITNPQPIFTDEIIFRGQANSEWTLTPSLFRSEKLHHFIKPSDLVLEEYRNLVEFQKLCDQAGVQIPGDSFIKRESQLTVIDNFSLNHMQDFWHIDFIETAAFAQHFGLETSFLDWSRNILTACYFACSSAMREFNQSKNVSGCFSIWVLNNKYLDKNFVKVIEPPKSINNHISYQNGLLTLAEINPQIANFAISSLSIPVIAKDFSLESVLSHYKKSHLLLKINIPISFAKDLFNYCNAYHFNACNLFRGAHGAVQHFKDIEALNMFLDNIDQS